MKDDDYVWAVYETQKLVALQLQTLLLDGEVCLQEAYRKAQSATATLREVLDNHGSFDGASQYRL